jgi:signal transduction histidine kinase
MLDYSQIENGKLRLVYKEFDVRDTLQSIVNLLSLKASSKNIEIRIKCKSDL